MLVAPRRNSPSQVHEKLKRLNASFKSARSIGGSLSTGPTQYRLLSPYGSFTTHARPLKENDHRFSLNQLRRISPMPSTEDKTLRINPSDQGNALETSKEAIVPSLQVCACVFMVPNVRHERRAKGREAALGTSAR